MFGARIERTAFSDGVYVGTEDRMFSLVDDDDKEDIKRINEMTATIQATDAMMPIPCKANNFNGWVEGERYTSEQEHYDYLKRQFLSGDGKCPYLFFMGKREWEWCDEHEEEYKRLLRDAKKIIGPVYVCRFFCPLEDVWPVICIQDKHNAMKKRLQNDFTYYEEYDPWPQYVHAPTLFK